jgi:hypothetical protein
MFQNYLRKVYLNTDVSNIPYDMPISFTNFSRRSIKNLHTYKSEHCVYMGEGDRSFLC